MSYVSFADFHQLDYLCTHDPSGLAQVFGSSSDLFLSKADTNLSYSERCHLMGHSSVYVVTGGFSGRDTVFRLLCLP